MAFHSPFRKNIALLRAYERLRPPPRAGACLRGQKKNLHPPQHRIFQLFALIEPTSERPSASYRGPYFFPTLVLRPPHCNCWSLRVCERQSTLLTAANVYKAGENVGAFALFSIWKFFRALFIFRILWLWKCTFYKGCLFTPSQR